MLVKGTSNRERMGRACNLYSSHCKRQNMSDVSSDRPWLLALLALCWLSVGSVLALLALCWLCWLCAGSLLALCWLCWLSACCNHWTPFHTRINSCSLMLSLQNSCKHTSGVANIVGECHDPGFLILALYSNLTSELSMHKLL